MVVQWVYLYVVDTEGVKEYLCVSLSLSVPPPSPHSTLFCEVFLLVTGDLPTAFGFHEFSNFLITCASELFEPFQKFVVLFHRPKQ